MAFWKSSLAILTRGDRQCNANGPNIWHLLIPNDFPQEAEPAILAVALTESRPDLLAVALQDATRENLKVFLREITNLFSSSTQGGRIWRASGDRQISLNASVERAFANFRDKKHRILQLQIFAT